MEVNTYLEKINYEENTNLKQQDIEDIERQIDFAYPMEYKKLLSKFNGGYGNIGEYYIDFWEVSDTLYYYEENEDIKDFIIFASDGCGMAFAFKKRDGAIYSIPMDSLEKEYSKRIADSYNDFVESMYKGQLKY